MWPTRSANTTHSARHTVRNACCTHVCDTHLSPRPNMKTNIGTFLSLFCVPKRSAIHTVHNAVTLKTIFFWCDWRNETRATPCRASRVMPLLVQRNEGEPVDFPTSCWSSGWPQRQRAIARQKRPAATHAATQTMTCPAPALVVEYVIHAPPPVVHAAPARTDECVAPAPVVSDLASLLFLMSLSSKSCRFLGCRSSRKSSRFQTSSLLKVSNFRKVENCSRSP